MRVLHLTTEFPPLVFGGIGTSVGGLVTGSARAGIDVGVQLVEATPASESGYNWYGYGYRGTGVGVFRRSAARASGIEFLWTSSADAEDAGVHFSERWRADVVHVHTATLWYVAQAIMKRGTPVIFHVHAVERAELEITQDPTFYSGAQDLAIESASRVVALSRSEAKLLGHYYPLAVDRVRVVGNGIADSPSARRSVLRRRPTGSPMVMYCGRPVARKGIRELFSAIPMVLGEVPEVRWVLVGVPPLSNDHEASRHWVGKGVDSYPSPLHFTGWLLPDRVAEWYGAADILVLPSHYEPFGMVILEAMLHGLAIVATRTGGPAEILDDGRTGILVPPRDVEALGRAIVSLAADAGLRHRMGRAAADEVRRKWLWSTKVREMRAVYSELTSSP